MKMKRKYNVIKVTGMSVKSVLKVVPCLFVISTIVSIAHSLLWGLSIVAKQKLFDDAFQYTNGTEGFRKVLLAIIIVGLLSILSQVFNGIDVLLYGLITNKAKGKLSFEIHKKLQRISPLNFENTKFIERLNVVEDGKNKGIDHALMVKDILAFYLPYYLFMGMYLFHLKAELAFSIIIVFLPIVLSQVIRTRLFENMIDESASCRRKAEYFENCIVDLDYYKETRILGIKKYFQRKWSDAFGKMLDVQFTTTIKTKYIEFLLQMMTVAGYIIILISLFFLLLQNEITMGAFVAVFSAIASMYGIMKGVVCYRIGGAAQNMGVVRNYYMFMDMEEEQGARDDIEEIGSIELKNVSFTYPQREVPSIHNLSLSIKKGERIALVGENGAGKTTLVKLITGLYAPTEGEIIINGQEHKKIHPSKIRKHFTAVFQKYQRYQMTVKNNIIISDTKSECTDGRLLYASEKAGVDLKSRKFKQGINTVLSRSFGDVDISGGEWQRLAIARCFYKDSQLVILDEPTAAIDPYEEKLIFDRFAILVKDRTSIIVTHRLASAKTADRIIVLEHGEICEIGTHKELMEKQGVYYQLYVLQQQWYKK